MRKMIRFLVAASVVAAAPVVGLTSATAAYAGTGTGCYGNGISALGVPPCAGLDPAQSYNFSTGAECSSGATSPLQGSVLGGYLELRWGPNCGTNWTRFRPGNNDEYEIWVTNKDTGVWAGTGLYNPYIWSNQAGISHYSDQVYAPSDPASACVRDITTNSNDFCFSQ